MASNGNNRHLYPKLVLNETLSVAIETFRNNQTRFMLTSLGMVIGTASLILVTTIGLTGKQYLLQQIQNVGSNMMVAEYQGGEVAVNGLVPGISASSPMVEFHDRITVPGGRERDILVLGVSWQYLYVRNLNVL